MMALAFAASLALFLGACEQQSSPSESLEEAAEETTESVEDAAGEAGDAMEEGAEKAEEAVEGATN
jgi:PBP1b-binding outer membrane lipoprotein LpoB